MSEGYISQEQKHDGKSTIEKALQQFSELYTPPPEDTSAHGL